VSKPSVAVKKCGEDEGEIRKERKKERKGGKEELG
jgi:hypothetical protein